MSKRLLGRLFFAAAIVGSFAAFLACSDDPAPATTPLEDAAPAKKGDAKIATGDDEDEEEEEDAGKPTDAGKKDATTDANCPQPVAPVADGGEFCGASPFGKPGAAFGGVDGGDSNYLGGSIPPGIYDAVVAERGSGTGGSWRETLVIEANGHYTRTRQVDTGSGPGPLTHRSGTIAIDGGSIDFVESCAYTDGAMADAAVPTQQFEVVTSGCNTDYRFGAAGIRITLRRR